MSSISPTRCARIVLRPMTAADIPQVTAIERASFPTTWPESAYRRELEENRLAQYIVAVEPSAEDPDGTRREERPDPRTRLSLLLARSPLRRWLRRPAEPEHASADRIVGYLGLWYMVDEAHIVAIATHPAYRRQGIGERLLARALELARERDIKTVTLEVRVSNEPAQRLYEKYGFRRVGLRPRYYTDNGEDALIMTTPPLDDPEYQKLLEHLAAQRRAVCSE
jgi:ribosomal-protein-alanine N-acetyltransferase